MFFKSHSAEPLACRFDQDLGSRVAFEVVGQSRDEDWNTLCGESKLAFQNITFSFRGVLRAIPGAPECRGAPTKDGVLIPGLGYIVGGLAPSLLFRNPDSDCCLILEENFALDISVEGALPGFGCDLEPYSSTLGNADLLEEYVTNGNGTHPWQLGFEPLRPLFGQQANNRHGQSLVGYIRSLPRLIDENLPTWETLVFPDVACAGQDVLGGGSCPDSVTDWATTVAPGACSFEIDTEYDRSRWLFSNGQCREEKTNASVTLTLNTLDSGECAGDCGGGNGKDGDVIDPGDGVVPGVFQGFTPNAAAIENAMAPAHKCQGCGG